MCSNVRGIHVDMVYARCYVYMQKKDMGGGCPISNPFYILTV